MVLSGNAGKIGNTRYTEQFNPSAQKSWNIHELGAEKFFLENPDFSRGLFISYAAYIPPSCLWAPAV